MFLIILLYITGEYRVDFQILTGYQAGLRVATHASVSGFYAPFCMFLCFNVAFQDYAMSAAFVPRCMRVYYSCL